MVSKGLGISLLPELMVRHSPYPVTACRPPMTFYRNIGIAVKDEKALSASTLRFVSFARGGFELTGVKYANQYARGVHPAAASLLFRLL